MNMQNVLHVEIATLRRQLDEANETIRQMREVREVNPLLGVLGLTKNECEILSAIVDHGRISREQLFVRVWGARRDPPDPQIIDVHLCRIRKRLKPYGMRIKTLWGAGWEMSKDDCERVRELARAA